MATTATRPRRRARPSGAAASIPATASRRTPGSGLCPAHEAAWRSAGCPEPPGFRRSASPCLPDRSGRVVFAGLGEDLITEVLYGIQAALAEGRQVMLPTLRSVVAHLRRSGAASLAEAASSAPDRTPVRWFCSFAADRAALALGDVSSEYQKDCWDLRLFGAAGRLSFTAAGRAPATPAGLRPAPSPRPGCARRRRPGPPRRCPG